MNLPYPFYSINELNDIENLIQDFDCRCEKYDASKVNDFLKKNAVVAHDTGLLSTNVMLDEENKKIVGFFSTNVDAIEITPHFKKAFSLNVNSFHKQVKEYPCVKVVYMGVDQNYQGQGIGNVIIWYVTRMIYQYSRQIGITFGAIEMLDEPKAVEFLKEYYGKFKYELLNGKLLVQHVNEMDI